MIPEGAEAGIIGISLILAEKIPQNRFDEAISLLLRSRGRDFFQSPRPGRLISLPKGAVNYIFVMANNLLWRHGLCEVKSGRPLIVVSDGPLEPELWRASFSYYFPPAPPR
jgi:hypothetical protein